MLLAEAFFIRAGLLRDQPAADRHDRAQATIPARPRWPRRRDARNSYHFLASGQQALPMDSQGNFWTGAERLLQRQPEARPAAQLLPGVRRPGRTRSASTRWSTIRPPAPASATCWSAAGVHIVAYAKALEKLTGVDVGKLLPIPDISNKQFPEAAKHEERGLHRILLPVQPRGLPARGRDLERHASGGRERAGGRGRGARRVRPPDLDAEPQLTAPVGPDIDPEMFSEWRGSCSPR